ncbi:MAG: FAD-dependent oxidoreductase [Collinsella sp.]
MHRNTFVDARMCSMAPLPCRYRCALAGQITGTEGYMEAVATGLLALNTYAEAIGADSVLPAWAPWVRSWAMRPILPPWAISPCMSILAWCRRSRTVSAAVSATAIRPMRTVRSRPSMPTWPRVPTCLSDRS